MAEGQTVPQGQATVNGQASSVRSIRIVHGLLIALTVPLGLASRMAAVPMPGLVREYGGDVLSAVCIFFGVRFVLHHRGLRRCALISYLICVLIELQQLITWAPLHWLREDTPLDILLGHGFLWSDLVCYAVGVAAGFTVGSLVESRSQSRSTPPE